MVWNFNRFWCGLGFALLSHVLVAAPTISQERNLLCSKFPLNSRCQGDLDRSGSNISYREYRLDRETFCQNFSFNARCQSGAVETINFNLQDEEWIRVKKSGSKIELAHSERTKNGLVSLATEGILDLIPLPNLLDDYSPFGIDEILPFDLNQYGWEDHPIIRVSFKQDSCPANDCLIAGKNTIHLPQGIDFSDGIFTVEYQEREFQRSVTFRIPADIAVEVESTIMIRVPYRVPSP